jgi:hypothetical protein
VSDQLHAPAALPPGKSPQYPLDEGGWAPDVSEERTTGLDGVKSQKIVYSSICLFINRYGNRTRYKAQRLEYTAQCTEKVNNPEDTRRASSSKNNSIMHTVESENGLVLVAAAQLEGSQQQRQKTRFKQNRHYETNNYHAVSCWYIQTHAQAGTRAKRGYWPPVHAS